MKKKAFLDQYKKEALFSDGFEEFDSSREIVQELINEYEACETPEYVNWVSSFSCLVYEKGCQQEAKGKENDIYVDYSARLG
jgi:tubulin gamma